MSDQRREGVERRVGRVDGVSSVVRRWRWDEVVKLCVKMGVSLGLRNDLKGFEAGGWCIARHSGRRGIMIDGVAC